MCVGCISTRPVSFVGSKLYQVKLQQKYPKILIHTLKYVSHCLPGCTDKLRNVFITYLRQCLQSSKGVFRTYGTNHVSHINTLCSCKTKHISEPVIMLGSLGVSPPPSLPCQSQLVSLQQSLVSIFHLYLSAVHDSDWQDWYQYLQIYE